MEWLLKRAAQISLVIRTALSSETLTAIKRNTEPVKVRVMLSDVTISPVRGYGYLRAAFCLRIWVLVS